MLGWVKHTWQHHVGQGKAGNPESDLEGSPQRTRFKGQSSGYYPIGDTSPIQTSPQRHHHGSLSALSSKPSSARSTALSQVHNLFQRRRRGSSSYKPSFASRGSSSTGETTDSLIPRPEPGAIRRSNSSIEISERGHQQVTRLHSSVTNLNSVTQTPAARIEKFRQLQVGTRSGIAGTSDTDLEQLKESRNSPKTESGTLAVTVEQSPSKIRRTRFAEAYQSSPSSSPTTKSLSPTTKSSSFEFGGTSRIVSVDPPSTGHSARVLSITASQDSNSSSGLGGMSSTSSPTFERLLSPRAQINGSVSLSSSMSSISTASNTSLDAVGTTGKRVMFGMQHERAKMVKEPPSVKEARQAALKFAVASRGIDAAATGNLTLLRRLSSDTSSGMDFTAMTRDTSGSTAIHKAAENGQLECLRFLLEQCRSPRDATSIADDDYRTPCMLAVENGHVECVKLLVKVGEGDLEIDDHGLTLVHHAAHHGQVECLEFLLDELKNQGKDPSETSNDYGVTPAHVAAQQGHLECLRVLLEAGADVLQADSEETTPIDWAKQGQHTLCAHYLNVVQSCWTLHEELETANSKLSRVKDRNATLERQLAKVKEDEERMKMESEKMKNEYERRIKEAKEDFVQLMTRLVKEVGSPSQLAQQMQGMQFGSQSPTPWSDKRRDSVSSGRSSRRDSIGSNSSSRSVSSSTQGDQASGYGAVLPLRERERSLDSLELKNLGLSDQEEEDEEEDDGDDDVMTL